MSNIYKAFENKKAFIGFLTAGDPNLETTKQCIFKMVEAGADIIEIGIPFSDPIAEGIVIQNANIRALNAKTNIHKIFDMLKEVRKKTDIPLVFLTYINPVFSYGYESFFKKCEDIGIDGIIIPDLPFEERNEISDIAKKYKVDIISLVALTSMQRIEKITKDSSGFVYVVSSLGVTGTRDNITTDVKAIIDAVRTNTKTPVCVGFGINNVKQVKYFTTITDGVIVGSAIVKIIEQYGSNSPQFVYKYVKEMKDAMNGLC